MFRENVYGHNSWTSYVSALLYIIIQHDKDKLIWLLAWQRVHILQADNFLELTGILWEIE